VTQLARLESDDDRARRQLEAIHFRVDRVIRARIRELKAEIAFLWEDLANGRRSD